MNDLRQERNNTVERNKYHKGLWEITLNSHHRKEGDGRVAQGPLRVNGGMCDEFSPRNAASL